MIDENSELWVGRKSSEVSLRELVAPLFRQKRILILTFVVTLVAALLYGALVPSEYTSHTAILVNRERIDPIISTEATTPLISESDPVTEEEMNSEAELLKSRDILEKVVVANGLQNRGGSTILNWLHPKQDEADRIARAVRSLAKRIKVGAVTKTNLIDVDYSSSNPQSAYDVLETLDDTYMDRRIAIHRPPGSFGFFAQETQDYHKALEDSEARLKAFGEQQGAAAPDLERTDLATQVAGSIGQLHQSEELIAADEQRIRSDQVQMQTMPPRSATLQSTAPADRLLEDLQSTLLAAKAKREQLALKYDPHYPLVQEADQEIAAAQAAVAHAEAMRFVTETTDRDPTYELLKEDQTKTEADLAAQRANLAAIKGSIDSLQGQMADLDQKAITQDDLERDVKANESNYLLYLSKREQERTSDALDKTRIANVAIAIPPEIPALPDHSFLFYALEGFCLAIVLALGMAYIVEYFDSRFHTPVQVADILGIPVVVGVPKEAV